MIIRSHPSELHTLYNPCIISVFKELDETKAVLYISESFNIFGSTRVITVEREYFNDVAIFDIRNILKSLFQNSINPILPGPLWKDSNLFVEYSVWFKETHDLVYQATAVNAVAQIGESSNYSDKRGRFLTAFDRVKKYNGYPVELVVLAFREGNTYIRFDGENFTQVDANVFVLPLPIFESSFSVEIGNYDFDCFLRDNAGRVITGNLGNGIEWTGVSEDYKQFIMPIEEFPMPENPFYIRWINRQGGYDYWMFSYRQYLTRSISNQQTFNQYVENQETADSFEELYDLSANESVRVGTEGLNANDYDCVSKLIYSPRIEHYNPETMKWTRIFVEKGDNELDTRSILNQLEFTFKLPAVQLQF